MMTRLTRSRKGKTPVDVVATEQNGLKRVRISMGDERYSNYRNTDMDERETRELITMLEWHLAKVEGRIDWDA
jgi:hypothetical protein